MFGNNIEPSDTSSELQVSSVRWPYVFQLSNYCKYEDTAVLRPSDTVTRTTNSLVLTKIKGWQEGKWFLGKYGVLISRFISRHLCQCMLYRLWAFLDTFWTIFRTYRQRYNRRLWQKQKCFLPLTRFYSNVHVHTLAGAHFHVHYLIKARTLSIWFMFSLGDSVPKVHLQG